MSLMLLRILYLEGCNCTLSNDFVFSDKAIQFVLNMKTLIYLNSGHHLLWIEKKKSPTIWKCEGKLYN